jgi:hypothetical protein
MLIFIKKRFFMRTDNYELQDSQCRKNLVTIWPPHLMWVLLGLTIYALYSGLQWRRTAVQQIKT